MVDIGSLDALAGIVGDVAGALAVMIEDVGTAVVSPSGETGPSSSASPAFARLDLDMVGKQQWIAETFAAKMSEVPEQSATTVQATDLGTTILADADIEGSETVRSAEV